MTQNDLNLTQQFIWRRLAQFISDYGLTPKYEHLAELERVSPRTVRVSIDALCDAGYVAKRGTKRYLQLDIKKWPEDIKPRETEGRINGNEALPRAAKQQDILPVSSMCTRDKKSFHCKTPGCRLTKQPGRDHCASCLSGRMARGRRVHMAEVTSSDRCVL